LLELEHVSCNLCGADEADTFLQLSYADYLGRRSELANPHDPLWKNREVAFHRFSIVKCRQCGLCYVSPRLTQQSLLDLYGESYFSFYTDPGSKAHVQRKLTMDVEIEELERLCCNLGLTNRRLLDVGCGGGFFLSYLGPQWERYGIEINPSAVEFARKELNLNVLNIPVEQCGFPAEFFGVIKLRSTIEHLYDPVAALRSCHRLLDNGGLLAIKTPNIDSLAARVYRDRFRLVDPIHHLYYFSTKTLKKLLRQLGFRVVAVVSHYFDSPYRSWRHPLKIAFDWLMFRIKQRHNAVSPPFYGNVIDVYARKQA
jgi:SAM-dependent methyltransferase